ncbi:MAG: peroxiredoxin [Betaproteobacteria bacterium]|nr:peroxiredoxin [Betaproteobacteria bacterium]
MLKVGQRAPAFELPDSGMEMVRLSRFKGKNKVVLFFYPKDSMPQCRDEAINFSDREDEFLHHGAVVMGVSQDDILCHADFCEAHGLNSRLLSDVEGEVCRRYGVLHEKEMGGHVRTCVDRVTYVIDRDGVVRHVVPVQNSRDHVVEVLKLVKEM